QPPAPAPPPRTAGAAAAALAAPASGPPPQARAKYAVGADGAGAPVRKAIGHARSGGAATHAWSVMHALAGPDCPDSRTKCAIHPS
ncbi:FAD-dependent monooxygenase, partial [Micrococcus sp. SIMBA_131]